MVHITCDGGQLQADCGSTTFHLNFKPPLRADAVCTECGYTVEIGKEAVID
jgi:hypothetical protein